RMQLSELLRGAMFTPTLWRSCLFVPPFGVRPFIRSALAWERLGRISGGRFAGVILVEAAKQMYATPPLAVENGVRRLLTAPVGRLAPGNATGNVTGRAGSATMPHSDHKTD
ncbi:MAG: methyltransferase type 11, partial [Nitratireductor sp.]